MALFILEKDGIQQQVISIADVARLKALGYKEVKAEPEPKAKAAAAAEISADEQNAAAVAEASKPIGSKKGK